MSFLRIPKADFFFLLGGGAVCAGIWMLLPAAGVIAGGLFLILISVSVSKPAERQ